MNRAKDLKERHRSKLTTTKAMQTSNIVTNPSKIWRKSFGSLTELVTQAMEPADEIPDMYRKSRNNEADDKWAGGSFEDAVQMATYGWSDGFKKILDLTKEHKKIFDDVFPRQDLAKVVIRDVEGEMVDIGLAVQGIPESMITTTEDITTKIIPGNKLQRIFYQNSFSCNIQPQTVFNYGAMVCCLVNSMEGHGFRTEIVARSLVATTYQGGDKIPLSIYDCRIKKFEDSPDYNNLAHVFASASYLRRLIFALQEQESKEYHGLFGVPDRGYGYPCNYKEDLVEATDIYIPYIESNLDFATIAQGFRQIIDVHFKEQRVKEEGQ